MWVLFSFFLSQIVFAQSPWKDEVFRRSLDIENKMIEWRRDIHQHPELGESEVRTSQKIAEHLQRLGMEVHTKIAKTGVVGILRGQQTKPIIALRADMDALPVKELTSVPFASKAKGMFRGQEVDVMHACGHDTHVAILMAVAEIFSDLKKQNKLKGTVMFIFQPAEEGPGNGREVESVEWGARQMLKEGLFRKILKPDVIYGLHVSSMVEAGTLFVTSGPAFASYDDFFITVKGRQTHASLPWEGIDPVLAGAKVVESVNQIVSRRLNINTSTAMVTVATFHSGMRENIIPEEAKLTGTIRTYDDKIRQQAQQYTREAAEHSAQALGAKATVRFQYGYDVTVNDEGWVQKMLPSLKVASDGKVAAGHKIGGSEDFSYYAKEAPGIFFFLGVTPKKNVGKAAPNHSGQFYVDESSLKVGVRSLSLMTLDTFDLLQEKK